MESEMQPSRNCLKDERPKKKIHSEVFSNVIFSLFFSFQTTSLKCTLLHRHSNLQGVGRGVTEPDIKQKLGQVRGARRGRQERACGIEPCVGTNLTCPLPLISSPICSPTHSPPSPLPLSPLLYFLSIVFITLCPHCKLRAETENKSLACVFC